MFSTYAKWNRGAARWLWAAVVLAVLAALPLAYDRWATERTPGSNRVEFVFDYRDLIELSTYQTNPEQYRHHHLQRMKQLGIGSMAVYESTLKEWKDAGRIQLYNAQEAAVLTGGGTEPGRNRTYLLFADGAARTALEPLLLETFRDRLNVGVAPWSFGGRSGYAIDMGFEEAQLQAMCPDPLTMRELRDAGFQVVVRLSNRNQPFSVSRVEDMFREFQQYGVTRIVFDGTEVTGYDEKKEKNHVPHVAALMKEYGIGAAAIELLKEPQKGFRSLADQIEYNVVRLTSVTEKEVTLDPDKIADRIVLAVKDRNIRMVFLNSSPGKDPEKGVINDYLYKNIYPALEGSSGAVERVRQAGYELGVAQAFQERETPLQEPLKALVLFGVVALASLLLGEFAPPLRLAAFAVGLAGLAALTLLSAPLALQAAALAAGIAAPTLAVIRTVKRLQAASGALSRGVVRAVSELARALVLTFVGIAFMVALLNDITYSLLLQQYRGVSLHHAAPIILVGIYIACFRQDQTFAGVIRRAKSLLLANLNVLVLVLALIGAAGGMYYLSRTGNTGQAAEWEKAFRSLLENTLGARPRAKEFLIGHPLFVAGVYLALRYRWGVYLLIGGVVGQLSVAGTFAHFHTLLAISLLRVFYGAVFGTIIGLALTAVWEVVRRSWARWAPK